ncbi:MAG TPA: glycosyltransferase [Bacteroidota bacterium]|nr:glycosyltransferase [Bacteroidota bacterium]
MPSQEITYLIFAPHSWESQHSRSRAFAIELSKAGCRTIYINPPSSFAGVVRETAAAFFYPLRRENIRFNYVSDLMEIWSPPMLPTFYRGSFTPDFDRWLFKKWFDKKISTVKDPIVAIIGMPFWWDGYINQYKSHFSLTAFDYQDPTTTYARNAAVYAKMEQRFNDLVSDADGIVAHTDANFKSMLRLRKPSDVCLIRNGSYDPPDRIESSSKGERKSEHPVIGTLGRITDNIDVALLLNLADHFQNCTIENIGTAGKYVRALHRAKNITLIPPMPPDRLSRRVESFDVGILPYRQNIEGSPLRVYDLLSASLQIVSTNFPDSDYFRDVIHVARDHKEFISKVEKILHSKDGWIPAKAMQDFLRHNTWHERIIALIDFCDRLLRRA